MSASRLSNSLRVHALATRFRRSLNENYATLGHIELQAFPGGSCAVASVLLGRFLQEEGCGIFDYVNRVWRFRVGRHWEERRHSWLLSGRLIVDITADQFVNMPAVFVKVGSTWHRRFKAEQPDDTRPYTDLFNGDYPWLYHKVRQAMNASQI